MPNLELTDEQVMQLVKQLPPERQRAALPAMAAGAAPCQIERLQRNQNELQRLSIERGKDWASMSEAEREAFVDDLIHEDRACGL